MSLVSIALSSIVEGYDMKSIKSSAHESSILVTLTLRRSNVVACQGALDKILAP